MIVVSIELWPRGDAKKAKRLGTMTITNTGIATARNRRRADYTIRVYGQTGVQLKADQTFELKGWPRLAQPIFSLVRRACEAVGY